MLNHQHLSDYIEIKRQEYNVAGIAVGVTDRAQTLFAKGFGVESVERPALKVQPDTLFKIASITKMITGITIMKLVEDGLL